MSPKTPNPRPDDVDQLLQRRIGQNTPLRGIEHLPCLGISTVGTEVCKNGRPLVAHPICDENLGILHHLPSNRAADARKVEEVIGRNVGKRVGVVGVIQVSQVSQVSQGKVEAVTMCRGEVQSIARRKTPLP